MPNSIRFVVLAALALGLATAANARTPIHRQAPSHHHAARARSRHRVLEMSDSEVKAEPTYRGRTPIQQDGRIPTSVEYRFGRTVGALGYNHADGPNLDPHAVNSAASTQLGRPDGTVGAKVSIPF